MSPCSIVDQFSGRIAAPAILAAALLFFSSCSLSNNSIQAPPSLTDTFDTADMANAAPALPPDYIKEAMNLLAGGKDGAARLLALQSDFHDTQWALRASFLLGTIALGKNDLANAERNLNDALGLEDIRDYVLFNLARTKRLQGQTKAAVEACDTILRLYPDSPLRSETIYEKAAALSEGADINGAITAISELIGTHSKSALTPDALLKYAQWSWQLRRTDDALNAIRRIRINYPADAAAPEADRLLANIKSAEGRTLQLASEDILIRAQKLAAAARYNDAVHDFSSVFKNSSGQLRCRSASLLGQTQIKLKRYAAAQKSLHMFLDEKTGCDNAPDSLYWLGLTDLRLGRLEELARVEKRLDARFTNSGARAKVLTLLASFYEDNNDEKGALRIYRLIISKWPGSSVAEQAYWRAGWIEYSSGGYLNAYRDFSSYAAMAPDGKGIARFLYWSGRAAEKAGHIESAASAYASVCSSDAGSFYCLLASAQPVMKARNAAAVSTAKPAAVLNGDAAADGAILPGSRYPVVIELLAVRMTSRAAAEIELLMETYQNDPQAMIILARLYAATGEYGKALNAWKKYFNKPFYESDTDEQAIPDIAFPSGIVDVVKKAAGNDAVDPYLVAAVMREESCFNPMAVSPAGAMGLLQVMPKTGSFAAKKLGIKDFERLSLFRPGVNIRIGAWYLGYLALRFNNDLVLTVAGYNAGPNAAAKWIKTLPRETDEFIEAIPYKETRHYVMRVISSYAQYLRLSGINPEGLLLHPMITKADNDTAMTRPAAIPVDPKWRVDPKLGIEESAQETDPAKLGQNIIANMPRPAI